MSDASRPPLLLRDNKSLYSHSVSSGMRIAVFKRTRRQSNNIEENPMENTEHACCSSEIDIVLHINEDLDAQDKQRVEQAMRQASGIGYAAFDRYRRHLLIIGYNPERTDSTKILELVRQQQLHPQLVVGL